MGVPSFQGSSEQLFSGKLLVNRGIVSLIAGCGVRFHAYIYVLSLFIFVSCMEAGLSDS